MPSIQAQVKSWEAPAAPSLHTVKAQPQGRCSCYSSTWNTFPSDIHRLLPFVPFGQVSSPLRAVYPTALYLLAQLYFLHSAHLYLALEHVSICSLSVSPLERKLRREGSHSVCSLLGLQYLQWHVAEPVLKYWWGEWVTVLPRTVHSTESACGNPHTQRSHPLFCGPASSDCSGSNSTHS